MSDVRLTLDKAENGRLLIVDAATGDTIATLADTALAPARARLMAAAPDLLAALEGLLNEDGHAFSCLAGTTPRLICTAECRTAKAAIQSARGLEDA